MMMHLRGLSLFGHEVLIALNSMTAETLQVKQQTRMQKQTQPDIIFATSVTQRNSHYTLHAKNSNNENITVSIANSIFCM